MSGQFIFSYKEMSHHPVRLKATDSETLEMVSEDAVARQASRRFHFWPEAKGSAKVEMVAQGEAERQSSACFDYKKIAPWPVCPKVTGGQLLEMPSLEAVAR